MSGRGLRAVAAAGLFDRPRYEVLPTASVVERACAAVPKSVTLSVTASPSKGLDTTLQVAEQLAAEGYRAVPHLSARLVADNRHLEEIAARLAAKGIEEVFVPAGDADPPAGAFEGALPVLVRLAEMGRPFRVGITGYPESHPRIDDDLTIQAMWDKRLFADYIVSNLCLDPKVLSSWIHRVRRRGVDLPLYLGLAGPVERTKLLSIASKIGVSESTRFFARHIAWFARLGAPGGYSPERFIERLAGALTAPEAAVAGFHVFTFNQLAETEAWRRSLLERFSLAATS